MMSMVIGMMEYLMVRVSIIVKTSTLRIKAHSMRESLMDMVSQEIKMEIHMMEIGYRI